MKKIIGLMQGRLTEVQNNRIQQFPFDNWANEFKILNKLGINKIEWLIDEHFKENPLLNKKHHNEIIKQKNKHNINIVSVCCDNFMFNSFFDDKFSFKKLKQLINSCNILNIKQLDIPLLGKNSIKNSIKKNYLIENLNKFYSLLKKKNVVLTFETDLNHKQTLSFVSKLKGNENFGITYDTGNSTFFGYDYKKEINTFGEYIKTVHVKDCTKKDYSVPLGMGHTKFNEILKLLKKKNYNGNFIFQTARKGINSTNEIKGYLKFFKDKLNKYYL